jgi:hypothetical protein
MVTIATLATSVVLVFTAFFGTSPSVPTSAPTSPAVTQEAEVICEEDMPCWECETMGNKICGDSIEGKMMKDAWASYENLPMTSSDTNSPTVVEHVASFDGAVPDFDETHFHVPSYTNPTLTHVFKVVVVYNA